MARGPAGTHSVHAARRTLRVRRTAALLIDRGSTLVHARRMARLTRLQVENLCLSRGTRTLFRGLSFAVEAGCAAALVGENGVGKTSVLRAIAGLLEPTAGTIRFFGDDGVEADEAIRRQAHLVGHLDGLAGSLTAWAEVEFAVAWTGGSIDVARKTVSRLGLERVLDLPVRKLSAGQRRRLTMIRLVASPRPLWLLDEPTTALDAASRGWMEGTMRAHLDGGGLIVAAAHDPLPIDAVEIDVTG